MARGVERDQPQTICLPRSPSSSSSRCEPCRTRIPRRLPWTSGVFDGEGLDDILQTIRVAYAKSDDARHVTRRLLSIPTGRVSMSEPSLAERFILGGTPFPRAADLLSPLS